MQKPSSPTRTYTSIEPAHTCRSSACRTLGVGPERSDGLAVDEGRRVGWLGCFAQDGVLNANELLGVRLALAADEDRARTIVVTTQPPLLTRPADLRSTHDNSLARIG